MQLTAILALIAAPLLVVAEDYPVYPTEYPTTSIESTTTCTSTTTQTMTITISKVKSTSTCYNSTISYHPTGSVPVYVPSSYPTKTTKAPVTVPTSGAGALEAAGAALMGVVGIVGVALL